jgi:hypothetical protein
MPLDIGDILDRLTSHALASGHFETVNEFKVDEPGGAGSGITLGIWSDDIVPVKSSGLASVSVRINFKVRIFASTESPPESYLERAMVDATSALWSAYALDFELGGEARHIDLLGAEGQPLSANAHYMNLSGVIHRVVDITVPVIVNDVFDLAA